MKIRHCQITVVLLLPCTTCRLTQTLLLPPDLLWVVCQLGLAAGDSPYIFVETFDDKGYRMAKQAVPVTAEHCAGQGLKVPLISVPSFDVLVIVRKQQLLCGGRAKEEEVGG